MIHCPDCGEEHYPGALFCDMCGAAIHPAAQAHLAAARRAAERPAAVQPPTTSRRVTESGRFESYAGLAVVPPRAIHVHVPHHDVTLTLAGSLIHAGRADPDDGYAPELDLAPYGGQEHGVSRRHATIQWIEGSYVLMDQHSSNGTWLNGVRLVAGYAYQIPPGANVRFGGLLVQLTIAD